MLRVFMNKNSLLTGARIFFAFLGFSGFITEIVTLRERGTLIPAQFFSYFTIESNLIAVVVLILSALPPANKTQRERIALLRGSSSLNMIVVGIVFSLLLAGLEGNLTAAPWTNISLHYIMPAFVAFDWIMDLPKTRIAFRSALVWMIFPTVYLTYSLIRGHFVGWYPYPFLNPTEQGYPGVAVTCIGIALGATLLTWMLARFTGRVGTPGVRR